MKIATEAGMVFKTNKQTSQVTGESRFHSPCFLAKYSALLVFLKCSGVIICNFPITDYIFKIVSVISLL